MVMAMARILVVLMAIFAVVLTTSFRCGQAQELAPAPAPTSDGNSHSLSLSLFHTSTFYGISEVAKLEVSLIKLAIVLCVFAGSSIDQGIAYLLMLLALALTYLIH